MANFKVEKNISTSLIITLVTSILVSIYGGIWYSIEKGITNERNYAQHEILIRRGELKVDNQITLNQTKFQRVENKIEQNRLSTQVRMNKLESKIDNGFGEILKAISNLSTQQAVTTNKVDDLRKKVN